MTTLTESPGRSALRSLAMCCLIAFFEGIDLQAPGVAAPRLVASLHLTAGQLGWFFSIGTCGQLLGALNGGRLADRIGRKRVLMGSVAVFGLFTVGTGLATTYPALIVLRGITGLGLGGAFPNLLALSAENAPPHRKRGAVAIVYAALPAGGTLACALALALPPSAGWQTLFLIGGAAPLVALPALQWLLPDSAAFQRARAEQPAGAPIATVLFAAPRWRSTLLLWGSFLGTMLVFYLLLYWLPSLLIGRGLSRPDASWVQLFFNVAGVAGVLGAGNWMDGPRRLQAARLAYVFSAVSLLLLAITTAWLAVAVVVGSLAGAATMATQGVLFATAPPLYPTRMRGTGVGAALAMGRVGSIGGPLLAGTLIGLGHGASYVLLTVLPVLAVAGVAACVLVGERQADS